MTSITRQGWKGKVLMELRSMNRLKEKLKHLVCPLALHMSLETTLVLGSNLSWTTKTKKNLSGLINWIALQWRTKWVMRAKITVWSLTVVSVSKNSLWYRMIRIASMLVQVLIVPKLRMKRHRGSKVYTIQTTASRWRTPLDQSDPLEMTRQCGLREGVFSKYIK